MIVKNDELRKGFEKQSIKLLCMTSASWHREKRPIVCFSVLCQGARATRPILQQQSVVFFVEHVEEIGINILKRNQQSVDDTFSCGLDRIFCLVGNDNTDKMFHQQPLRMCLAKDRGSRTLWMQMRGVSRGMMLMVSGTPTERNQAQYIVTT